MTGKNPRQFHYDLFTDLNKQTYITRNWVNKMYCLPPGGEGETYIISRSQQLSLHSIRPSNMNKARESGRTCAVDHAVCRATAEQDNAKEQRFRAPGPASFPLTCARACATDTHTTVIS